MRSNRHDLLRVDFPAHSLDPEPATTATATTAAPEVLEKLVQDAERVGASDIHLQRHGPTADIAFRLDGVIAPVTQLPAETAERVFGRIKYLARLKTYQDSMPQDGRIDRVELKSQNDVRVATYPTVRGEKIVLRLFNSASTRTLGELDFSAATQTELENFLHQPAGMLLLTGPAGSGKTTTIYACLKSLVELGGRHVITIEDPAEQIVPGVMQTEINEARGLDFAKAARHLLRQDPQVLVIGEIRDDETANLAVRAALTGHLVISTLHAGSCRGVLERLLVLCPDHSAVAASVELILNQRLVRRLCAGCAGQGCSTCLKTGFHGRLPVLETLRINDAMRRGIARHTLEEISAKPSLVENARSLVEAGLTNEPEIRRVLG
ncbi:MAG: Flp pilus assembly complex ATPase component TadA [Akkermansiaceae bacterium]|nr:Flp pilus assembly complex ATPase component TadA [Verrucomicrobiales bacterium]